MSYAEDWRNFVSKMTLPARRPSLHRDDLQAADLHRPVLEPQQEAERLNALHELDVLDSPAEEAFDRITRLTKKLFDVPVAIVSFIDAHRQWYKSSLGATVTEVSREQSFCQYVIADGTPIVVTNATQDSRFAGNPYVITNPGVRFYAGFPLQTRNGHNVGTLCLVDVEPRVFDADQLEIMSDLAHGHGRASLTDVRRERRAHGRTEPPRIQGRGGSPGRAGRSSRTAVEHDFLRF
jgi:hypothetical protein